MPRRRHDRKSPRYNYYATPCNVIELLHYMNFALILTLARFLYFLCLIVKQ